MKEDPEALPFILDDIVELDLSTPYKTKFHDIPSSKEEDGINKRLKTKNIDGENSNKTRHSKKRLSGLVNDFIDKKISFSILQKERSI